MTEVFHVVVAGNTDSRLRAELDELGEATQLDDRRWTVPAGAITDFMATLNRRGMDFRVALVVEPGQEAAPDERAAYLSYRDVEDFENLGEQPSLIYGSDAHPFASREVVQLLQGVTSGLVWQESDKRGLWRLADATELPEPNRVKVLNEKYQGRTGRWMLFSDGREYIAERGIEHLRRFGAAWNKVLRYEDELYPIVPSLVWSGRVIEALVRMGVAFDGPPQYLLMDERGETS